MCFESLLSGLGQQWTLICETAHLMWNGCWGQNPHSSKESRLLRGAHKAREARLTRCAALSEQTQIYPVIVPLIQWAWTQISALSSLDGIDPRPCSARLSNTCTAGTETGQITNEIWLRCPSANRLRLSNGISKEFVKTFGPVPGGIYIFIPFVDLISYCGQVLPGWGMGACEWFSVVPPKY